VRGVDTASLPMWDNLQYTTESYLEIGRRFAAPTWSWRGRRPAT